MSALILTSPKVMTNRLPGTPRLRVRGEKVVVTSDTFTAPDGQLAGRLSDAALGGERVVWKGTNPEALVVTSGRMSHTAAAGSYLGYIESPGAAAREMELAVTVVALPTGSVYLDLFRTAAGITPNVKYRVQLNPSGAGSVSAGPTAEVLPGSNFTFQAGDRIAVTVNTFTDRIKLAVNGVQRFELSWVPTAPVAGEIFGIAGAAKSGALLDNFMLSETVL